MVDAKVATVKQKQTQAIELRQQLSRSLTLKSLFPDAFEGDGKVLTGGRQKPHLSVRYTRPQPVHVYLIKASGQKVVLTFEQSHVLKGSEYTDQELQLIQRNWEMK